MGDHTPNGQMWRADSAGLDDNGLKRKADTMLTSEELERNNSNVRNNAIINHSATSQQSATSIPHFKSPRMDNQQSPHATVKFSTFEEIQGYSQEHELSRPRSRGAMSPTSQRNGFAPTANMMAPATPNMAAPATPPRRGTFTPRTPSGQTFSSSSVQHQMPMTTLTGFRVSAASPRLPSSPTAHFNASNPSRPQSGPTSSPLDKQEHLLMGWKTEFERAKRKLDEHQKGAPEYQIELTRCRSIAAGIKLLERPMTPNDQVGFRQMQYNLMQEYPHALELLRAKKANEQAQAAQLAKQIPDKDRPEKTPRKPTTQQTSLQQTETPKRDLECLRDVDSPKTNPEMQKMIRLRDLVTRTPVTSEQESRQLYQHRWKTEIKLAEADLDFKSRFDEAKNEFEERTKKTFYQQAGVDDQGPQTKLQDRHVQQEQPPEQLARLARPQEKHVKQASAQIPQQANGTTNASSSDQIQRRLLPPPYHPRNYWGPLSHYQLQYDGDRSDQEFARLGAEDIEAGHLQLVPAPKRPYFYFKNKYDNRDNSEGKYPPATFHREYVGLAIAWVIGNTVFMPRPPQSAAEIEMQKAKEAKQAEEIDWMEIAATGYPGDLVKGYVPDDELAMPDAPLILTGILDTSQENSTLTKEELERREEECKKQLDAHRKQLSLTLMRRNQPEKAISKRMV